MFDKGEGQNLFKFEKKEIMFVHSLASQWNSPTSESSERRI